MRKCYFIIAFLFFVSCEEKKIQTPSEAGDRVFKILRSITEKTQNEYLSDYITLEEIHLLGRNKTVVKNQGESNYLVSMNEEKWLKRCLGENKGIRTFGVENGIDWKSIEYVKFIGDTTSRQGFGIISGVLYFKSNNKTYTVTNFAYYVNDEYKIASIETPRELPKDLY